VFGEGIRFSVVTVRIVPGRWRLTTDCPYSYSFFYVSRA
jgi:hypothetical protein